MEKYIADGHTRAKALNNRGPIRFESDGALGRDISDAYSEYGFYIFESVLASDELVDIKADVEALLALGGGQVRFEKESHPALHPE